MKALFHRKFLEHNIDSEAEGAYRLQGYTDCCEAPEINGEQYLELVHTPRYIEFVRNACQHQEYLAEVMLTPSSYEAALLAVGLTVKASESGDFAVVRPPGHHAMRERASGFCFFNNIAIAAQKLVNEGKKVFIFDIDGHHGDGTQSIFYDSDQVLYISIHQHYAYPFTGFPNETGTGPGTGFTVNFPLISGSGDKEFLEAVDKAIIRARQFAPDVVGVSAGFDAYAHDRILGLQLTKRAYYECAFRLRRAFPDIFAVLEGGYHQDIKACIDQFIEGIHNGAKPPVLKWDTDMSIG
ncbi:MAG: histone deacetylase [Bacteroidales bacterium]|jgi:acetoin utilization deacetylase AcuC-like enzyme